MNSLGMYSMHTKAGEGHNRHTPSPVPWPYSAGSYGSILGKTHVSVPVEGMRDQAGLQNDPSLDHTW